MTPENSTTQSFPMGEHATVYDFVYDARGTDLDSQKGVKEVLLRSRLELGRFLELAAKVGFTHFEHLHIPQDEAKIGGHYGIAIGRVRAVVSDGVLESFEGKLQYEGRTVRCFNPVFRDASYVAQIKTPPAEGEDVWADLETRNTQVIIASHHYARDIRGYFRQAGIPLSILKCGR